ncbi:uncharacterized protein HD556DRAFT_234643 [Suillus plorans]|uniref:Uncharacterized protein n=1 Tax=Suillus plorans TaxID=116603 RepID=A0A9P7DLC1_9AGAM|nr:uncharacterized protein HD556DRAFT_234643 [Suillus plorans]KAG1797691.1 hypothetical protein HD556DRAFT_234643 [Suillus plorans]
MYSYPPHSDQEDAFTDFGGAHDYHGIPQDAYNQIPSDTGLVGDYMYDPQHHAPQMYDNLAGGVPPNLPLPFHEMNDTGYLYQTPFDPVLSAPVAQELIRDNRVEPPFPEPQSYLTTILPPAPPTELTSLMTSSLRSSPRYSPMVASDVSGPSTLSPLNTSGVTVHSHSRATPLNRASQSPGFHGPDSMTGTGSRQSPISPSQKRPLESSADDMLHGRRVTPRITGASNVHSLPSSGGTSSTTTSSISSSVPGRGSTVPQELYNVGTTHAFHFTTGSGMPVVFNVAEGAGIPLELLLHRQTTHLQARDDRISDMSGDTISIRIEWPGYPSFTKQIASKDWKKTRSPNTRERLAVKVAGAVYSFFKEHAKTECDPPNSRWRIGPNGIRIEHLALVSLHRVSQGSWQPKLCLLRDDA